MDTGENPHAWRSRQLRYKLPIRTVYDREVGSFKHDTDSLRENSFAIINLSNGLEVGLVSKARNYSATEYDVLQTMLLDDLSAIHEMPIQTVRDFFSLTAETYDVMSALSGGTIVIGLNQHPEGFYLPEKDRHGNKQRVQTLQPLHVHIYEVSSIPDRWVQMADLPLDDQRDMTDPFLELSSAVLASELGQHQLFKGLTISLSSPDIPPWGLNIEIRKPLSNFLKEDSSLLVALQAVIFDQYALWHGRLNNEKYDWASIDKSGVNLPESAIRRLRLLASHLKREDEVAGEYTFTKGGAVTYTLFQNQEGHAVVSVHPRLMSKGNSADSMGIYVDNFEGEKITDILVKKEFYRNLLGHMATKYDAKSGSYLQE